VVLYKNTRGPLGLNNTLLIDKDFCEKLTYTLHVHFYQKWCCGLKIVHNETKVLYSNQKSLYHSVLRHLIYIIIYYFPLMQ
jgi:hypothetical protein